MNNDCHFFVCFYLAGFCHRSCVCFHLFGFLLSCSVVLFDRGVWAHRSVSAFSGRVFSCSARDKESLKLKGKGSALTIGRTSLPSMSSRKPKATMSSAPPSTDATSRKNVRFDVFITRYLCAVGEAKQKKEWSRVVEQGAVEDRERRWNVSPCVYRLQIPEMT